MKIQVLTLAASVAVLAPANGADFIAFHERMVDHLKALRNQLVPPPVIDFVETFPSIAIPRAKILHLAQAGESLAAPPVDPVAIADWANNLANFTTQHTLDGLFPRSTPRRPVIVGGEREQKTISLMEEDLNVMMRILEKAAGGKEEEKTRAMGIDVFSFGNNAGNSPRVFYIDGYGALFVLNVRYPLMAPPKNENQVVTNGLTSSEWDKAREEVYGRRAVFDELRINAAPPEDFDPQRVERLQQQIIDGLANATHMKNLNPDDFVTVVVLGGGSRGGAFKREIRGTPRSRGGRETHEAMEMKTKEDAATAQSTLTIRARKTDIDAFAQGKVGREDFQKKVAVHIH